MPYPHRPMGHSTDAPVRPGTSDALTARTIDATQHPPLVRAQETVVALGPRISQTIAPLASPVFLGLLALTLLFVWIAHRMRYRPSALLLSTLLVIGLTSFRPLPRWEQQSATATSRIPKTRINSGRGLSWYPDQSARRVQTPDYTTMPDFSVPVPAVPFPRVPEVDMSAEIMRAAEQIMRDERVREMVEQLQYRLREEARSRRWRRMAARYRAHRGDLDPIELVLTR